MTGETLTHYQKYRDTTLKYHAEHRQYFRDRALKYYYDHKEQIACECGSNIQKSKYNRHLKTNKHQMYMLKKQKSQN